jgi:glycosyltransferase involved in cell wall biosynthesis
MAAGTAAVSTDAHGNRDFCRHEENCLIVEADPEAVRTALARVLDDRELRARLAAAGRQTAQEYAWERRIDRLERFFLELAESPGPTAPRLSAAPHD